MPNMIKYDYNKREKAGLIMDDLTKLSWIDACKVGAYLVSTTESAVANMKEQLSKFQASGTLTTTLSDQIFGGNPGTPGTYAHQFYKLKLLLGAIHSKSKNEEDALKDFAYALRNMLIHSQYKSVIKHLEKPSTSPSNLTDYWQYIDETAAQFNEYLTPYSRTKYVFLYSFIKTIMETNKFSSKITLVASDALGAHEPFERYLNFVTQNNPISKLVQQHMAPDFELNEAITDEELAYYFVQLVTEEPVDTSEFSALSAAERYALFPLENDKISAVRLLEQLQVFKKMNEEEKLVTDARYFKKSYAIYEDIFAPFAINIQEVVQHTEFTTNDLRLISQVTLPNEKPKKRKKQIVAHVLYVALAKYLQRTTILLNELFQQEPSTKIAVQKATKPSANDAALKKELFDVKNDKKKLEVDFAKLQKELSDLKKEKTGIETKLVNVQKQNNELQQKLAQSSEKEVLPPNTKELVLELAMLVDELKTELAIEPVNVEVSDEAESIVEQTDSPTSQNHLQKVEHLKIAVVGGHAKFHNRIKNDFLQDVFTVSPDRLNSSVSKLLNYDVIVFVTSYNNHSLYERSYDYLKKNQAKDRCLILNTQPNPSRLAQMVYEFSMQ